MAAFYKYIKGYMSNGTTTQYIFFNQGGGRNDRPYFSNSSDATTKHYLVSEDGDHTFSGINAFGTPNSGTPDVEITSFWTTTGFYGTTSFNDTTNFNASSNFNSGTTITNFIKIFYSSDNNNFVIKKGDDTALVTFNDSGVTFTDAISSGRSVTAPFFNASSDRRLKTNINTIEDSVLPLITSTPVYTFNYKKDPTIPVIGIMAQDILDKNINDFNLVKKSGNNYYEIKESKMIYILWKAVQEQQKQIEALQARLEGEVNGEANN